MNTTDTTNRRTGEPASQSPGESRINQLPRIAVRMPEAAAMLGVSAKTIKRAIQRGDIRVTRKFRHKLIPITERERFINS
jgi:excisionase family DNA binding protein